MEAVGYYLWCIMGVVAFLLIGSCLGLLISVIGLIVRKVKRVRSSSAWTWLFAGIALVSGLIFWATNLSGYWRFGRSVTQSRGYSETVPPTTLGAIWSDPRQYFKFDDEEMLPFIAAMDAVDRASLGFTPIPTDANVEATWGGPNGYYDVTLFIYADANTSWTITFKRQGDGYVWLGEQEVHTGPNEFWSGDSYSHEALSITYNTAGMADISSVTIAQSGAKPFKTAQNNHF